jgi:hypothetical protein
MPRILMFVEFSDRATPPEGDPPTLSVHGESTRIEPIEGDAPAAAAFDSTVTMTGETSFVESGKMTFGNEDDLIHFGATGEGFLGPSPEPGMLQGSVIWRVNVGEGRFAGAEGLITSNFLFGAETGEAAEKQVISLFLP